MTRNRIFAFRPAAALLLGVAMLAAFIPSLAAQSTPAPDPQKIIKTRFSVVRSSPQALEVQSLTNNMEHYTFAFSPDARTAMQPIMNSGGYQYGDKITIWYHPGTTVALKIKGKPSKPK